MALYLTFTTKKIIRVITIEFKVVLEQAIFFFLNQTKNECMLCRTKFPISSNPLQSNDVHFTLILIYKPVKLLDRILKIPFYAAISVQG